MRTTLRRRIWLGWVLLLWLCALPLQAFYNPTTGRWLSRDPIEDSDKSNLYAFAHNNPLNHLDPDGRRTWVPYPYPGHWVDDPTPPPSVSTNTPPIDCSGYSKLGGAQCYSCAGFGPKVKDSYPEKAKKVCEGFAAQYTGTSRQGAAACVANCLIKAEGACQILPNCSDRNCCRLLAHVACYAGCGFVPNQNLPPGGWEVGMLDLLPSAALSPACRKLVTSTIPSF